MGIADAGTAAALYSAAPATKLIARAFMEHLLALLHLQWPNRGRSPCSIAGRDET
jgi:hypothetical protein